MTQCIGFGPVAGKDAIVLILGSLPGTESLRQQQYYAKKQNSFWKIMGEITGAFPELPYDERLQHLITHHIALWDVCAAARRKGSLDSAIQSPRANKFAAFFREHPHIQHICFNGQPAAKLFMKLVQPKLGNAMPHTILPSTSPAHAGMRTAEKLRRWRAAIEPLLYTDAP